MGLWERGEFRGEFLGESSFSLSKLPFPLMSLCCEPVCPLDKIIPKLPLEELTWSKRSLEPRRGASKRSKDLSILSLPRLLDSRLMLDNETSSSIRCPLEDTEYLSSNRRLLVPVDKTVMLERDLTEDLREERMDACLSNFCCFLPLDLTFHRMARMMMTIRAVPNTPADTPIAMARTSLPGGLMYGSVTEKEI